MCGLKMQNNSDTWPRQDEANDYLAEHKIPELFNNLTAHLIFEKPGNPKEYIIDKLESLKQSRLSNSLNPICIFDDSNIESVFGMLDPNQTGYIRLEQYKAGLTTLGITKFNEYPPGYENDKIPLAAFKKEANIGLVKCSSTYKPLK